MRSSLSSNPKFFSKEQQSTSSGASDYQSEDEAKIKSYLKRQPKKTVKKPKQSGHEDKLLLAEAQTEMKLTIKRCMKETDPASWKIKRRWVARLIDIFRDATKVK